MVRQAGDELSKAFQHMNTLPLLYLWCAVLLKIERTFPAVLTVLRCSSFHQCAHVHAQQLSLLLGGFSLVNRRFLCPLLCSLCFEEVTQHPALGTSPTSLIWRDSDAPPKCLQFIGNSLPVVGTASSHSSMELCVASCPLISAAARHAGMLCCCCQK